MFPHIYVRPFGEPSTAAPFAEPRGHGDARAPPRAAERVIAHSCSVLLLRSRLRSSSICQHSHLCQFSPYRCRRGQLGSSGLQFQQRRIDFCLWEIRECWQRTGMERDRDRHRDQPPTPAAGSPAWSTEVALHLVALHLVALNL